MNDAPSGTAAGDNSAYYHSLWNEARIENEKLRGLVKRLTDVAENLAGELTDPGSESLAAIYCGRHLIYG